MEANFTKTNTLAPISAGSRTGPVIASCSASNYNLRNCVQYARGCKPIECDCVFSWAKIQCQFWVISVPRIAVINPPTAMIAQMIRASLFAKSSASRAMSVLYSAFWVFIRSSSLMTLCSMVVNLSSFTSNYMARVDQNIYLQQKQLPNSKWNMVNIYRLKLPQLSVHHQAEILNQIKIGGYTTIGFESKFLLNMASTINRK